MLQIELKTFASDALEDAMRLAQTKALNSYSWSDCLNYLNYSWSDLYNRIVMIDEGYYSTTVQLNTQMTTLPPFVKNSIRVYAAQDPIGFNREIFRSSGMADLRSRGTYHISGFDLYCPDATRRTVWLNFAPIAPMLFFPRNNRDPKLYEDEVESWNALAQPHVHTRETPVPEYIQKARDYELYTLDVTDNQLTLRHKNPTLDEHFDVRRAIEQEDYFIHFVQCDFPYIFVTYVHRLTGRHVSGFYRDILHNVDFIEYNPFDFVGRGSNVEYLQCKYNDKTGLGVIVRDYDDYDVKEKRFRIKELGWTPDSILVYPCPEMYRYLVARLAEKFAAFNESEMMGVAKELVEAKYAFEAFCERDKSAWKRIDNVNPSGIMDWL